MSDLADLEARLDRLESIEAIRALSARYAIAVDARDVDSQLALYVDDFRLGPERGKEALRRSIVTNLGSGLFTTTIHFLGQHDITFYEGDPERATGVVYCRAEHETPEQWVVATLQYWDRYERRDGKWLFGDRRLKAFYAVDVLERPNGAERVKHQLTTTGLMARAEVPEAWPTWQQFQEETGSS
jgi:ketosteroid isomerase-like protein